MEIARVRQQVRRFYDGGVPGRDQQPGLPPDPGQDPRIVLERHTESGLESFSMERRIAYDDRHLGELLVPADPDAFRTDLTSVPALFTWLVPKTGAHLPAALLHDGLVQDPDEAASYVSTLGHRVDRVEADRIFRDAMADTGTGVVRRWIVWSAVTLATLVLGRDLPWAAATTWRYRGAVALTVLGIVVLGYSAIADLFDLAWPATFELPWMGERPWWLEVVGGFAGAVTIPVALGLLWGRFRMAGAIVGVLLAVLLPVTLGLAAIAGSYLAVERAAAQWPMVTAGIAALVVAVSVVVTLALSV
ncbi:MAG: DUF1353 domain-containing protein [Nocardioides sp.]|nr:DUF1353 domain-containing protein [Nocardioides sp.]